MSDYKKIDDDLVKPEKTLTAAIPRMLLRNIAAIHETRMPSAMHSWMLRPTDGRDFPEFSTHPEEWWGIPIAVPVPLHATAVAARVDGAAADADVKTRLFLEDAASDSYTFTAGAGAGWSDEMVAGIVPDNTKRWLLGMIAFQSQLALPATGTIDAGSSYAGPTALRAHVIQSGLSGTGVRHLAAEDEFDGRLVYIGAVNQEDADEVAVVWPSTPRFAGDLFDVGLFGLGAYYLEVQEANAFLPNPEDMKTGKLTRSDLVQRMSDAAWNIFSRCGHWYTCGLHGNPNENRTGVYDGTVSPLGAMVKRRSGSDGIHVVVLGRRTRASETAMTADVTVRNVSGSISETTTVRGPSISPRVHSREGSREAREDLLGELETYTQRYTTRWGGADLIRQQELKGLSWAEGVVPWPDGSSVGDNFGVSVGDNNFLIILGGSMWESFPATRPT